MLNRQTYLALVKEHIKNNNLVKHCLCVEAAMRGLAKHFGENEDLWGIVGLIHDADWEETQNAPETHTLKTLEWLEKIGRAR